MTRKLPKRRDGTTKWTSSSWTMVGGLLLALAAAPAAAQLPVPASSQFDITGLIQEATLDPACAASPHCGGTVKVNGHVITIPKETIVIFPAAAFSWQEVFTNAPPPYGVTTSPPTSGLAQADSPAPLGTYEIHVVGNRVPGAAGGDQYIAGMVNIAQNSLSGGAGFINFIDYVNGEIRVGGTIGSSTTGTRVRINDSVGRFGRAMFTDQRFVVDDANPTIASGTGFPMCLPRTDPSSSTPDALCPEGNRPIQTAGNPPIYLPSIQMTDPTSASFSPGFLDPNLQAPLEVGDYVTFSGIQVKDGTQPTVGPWPGTASTYVSAFTIIDNVAIYTAPGTSPAYVSIEVSLIGTGGLTVLGAGEATIRTKFEGMSTDPTRLVLLYGVDVDPLTGNPIDRDFGSVLPDPGPPVGAVKGRWRFRPPCTGTAPLTDSKLCVGPSGGTYLPPPREVRAVLSGVWSMPAAPNTFDSSPKAANGIIYGQYHAPIGEYIFPENIPGTPIVPNNFEVIDFLAKGGYTSTPGTVTGQLNPWPGSSAPTGGCQPPAITAGMTADSVASGGTLPVTVSATGSGTLTWSWTAPASGTLAPLNVSNPTFTAPSVTTQTIVDLALTVSNACGQVSATKPVTVSAALAPTVGPVAAVTVSSGQTISATSNPPALAVTGTDPNGQALTFAVTQTGTPALSNLSVNGTTCNTTTLPSTCTANITFTAPTLPTGTVTSSTVTLSVTARNATVTSAAEVTTVTIKPLADSVLIVAGGTEYRTGKQRLTISATSSVVSTNVVLTLQPYLTVSGTTFDPANLGNTFTNNGNGLYTLVLVGAPEPAVPPATPLTVKSNLGGISPPAGLDRIRQ